MKSKPKKVRRIPAEKTAVVTASGEMAERIRQLDWAKTPLGSPRKWSQSLKNIVSVMLVNRFPMLLWWGKDYIQIYNDAYIPVLATKHPWALGNPTNMTWKEIWPILKPLIDKPYKGGPATWMDDILLKINRNDFVEETHFIIAYSPVPDPTTKSKIGGVLATVTEITGEIIGKRQMETLGRLGKAISKTLTLDEVLSEAANVFRDNRFDIPFAFLHKISNDGNMATLHTSVGYQENESLPCDDIDLNEPAERWQTLLKSVRENKIISLDNEDRWPNLPKGAWDVQPECLVHVPVTDGGNKTVAVITIGLNPYRKFDETYQNFIRLVADQVVLGVSKAKAYEDEHKRAKILEDLDRAKTIFFSNISHEFRTPLTLMLGTMEQALQEQGIAPANVDRLKVAHRNALRLLKLVNTLLDFSRIESGRQKAHYAKTDIVTLTTNLASNFDSIIEKADLKFHVSADKTIPEVYVDTPMWEKIVFNLLSNAFKYTLKGEIMLRLFARDQHVVLEVEDTGIGIPEKELPRMFERFHRVENAQGRTYEGTGIGLSLTKELVNLHGGEIHVTSKEGQGSTFTVLIPMGMDHLSPSQIADLPELIAEFDDTINKSYVNDALSVLESASDETLNEKPKDVSGARVLIVDDNSDMRKHIRSLLEKQFNVITAPNGREALQLIKSEQPDLVLSDVMMPVMDGIQLLKAVKEDPATSNLPIILLTARAGEESKIEGFDTGADDYLVKPFSANELMSRIRAQLSITKRRDDRERELERRVDERTVQLREKNTELELTNKELESFNYVASHDLQEPLRKIQTFTHLIDSESDKDEAVKKYLGKISVSAKRMSELINSILVYSRLPQVGEKLEPTDLNLILDNVKVDFELIVAEKNAVIESDNLPVINAMPLSMHQLFSNLISNSLKFCEKDPVIRITSATVDVREIATDTQVVAPGQYHQIKFSDNGIGFRKEYREQIFKLFQRLNNRSKYAGTGVGLSIVSKIVNRHNGYIAADSTPGHGATFTVWLPAT